MRVLLTLASSSMTGPAERMLADAEALRAAGHEATLAFDTRTEGNLIEICAARRLPVATELKLSRHSGPLEIAQDVVRLRRRLRAGVDLVHAHFSHDHLVALAAVRGLQTRVVRSLEHAGTGSAWALRRTDGVEVPFAALADDPRLSALRARGRVAVLPAAVDAERFSPGSGAKLRAELGVAAEAPLIGIVSRVKPERLHEDLVAAFRGVVAQLPAARLAVIGRGEGLPALEAAVAAAGLTAQVTFAGYWAGPDLVEAYRGLDVAVWLAPGNDGSARGVLEAMAVGLPVVAYDRPPMSTQLADGAGVLVAPPELEGALLKLLRDPAERAAMGARARARVLERSTTAARVPALIAFYEGVLRG